MQQKKIVFLASDCESSRWVYNTLKNTIAFEAVILEQPISKKDLARRRIKKIGIIPVAGQILFSVIVAPFLKYRSKHRRGELVKQYHLSSDSYNENNLLHVSSVNDEACLSAMQSLQPDIVIVNGTRIISKKILQSTPAVFINMHVGITPWYRGSHGGYWAVKNNDTDHFGTTIHLVDAGVDSGAVLKQAFIKPGKRDNFATYPILQTAIGIEALQEVLPAVIAGTYQSVPNTEKGKLYYQPTIWQYFFG